MIHCEYCKSEINKADLFLNNKNWIEIQELYKQKGIDNPEFIQDIERQAKGLCFNCGGMLTGKLGMIATLAAGQVEKNVFDDAILFYNMTMGYDEIVCRLKAINVAEEMMLKLKMDVVKAHAILVALTRINGKPQHVDKKEKEMMLILKEKARLSNQDLSVVFQRSQETVHRTLKEMQNQ